jgi:hypothetical protein
VGSTFAFAIQDKSPDDGFLDEGIRALRPKLKDVNQNFKHFKKS